MLKNDEVIFLEYEKKRYLIYDFMFNLVNN